VAIITLAQYKSWAGISGTSDDTRLQELLDSAHAELRRYCGRSLSNGFESATRTEDYNTPGAQLVLREWPVTSITSITPLNTDNTSGTAFDSTSYSTDLASGVVTLNGAQNGRFISDRSVDPAMLSNWGWLPRFDRVRVVYVSDSPAADIRMALYRMVDTMYASVQRGSDIKSESIGQYSVTYASAADALDLVKASLSRYRAGTGAIS
jgi:hypothetical protein